MKKPASQMFRQIFGSILIAAVIGILGLAANAAKLSPTLQNQLTNLADNVSVGMVIVTFNTTNGLQSSHLSVLQSVGVTGGQTFPTLGIIAQPMTAGQVRALRNNPAVRSLWSNDRLYYTMNQARVLAGVQRLQTDGAMTQRNGGMPVSGAGDFSVMVIDSGIDATHADLQFGTKVIQNVHPIVGTDTLEGFTPNVSVENVPNTDQTVGHGTHCAGIIGGTGIRSGGANPGVAPGVKIVGAGLGAGLFVLNAVGAWEYGLANQYRYNIRVVSNSYGSDGAFDPNAPLNVVSKMAYDRNITVVFAGGNSGPTKNTYNPYAKAPWVIGVAAGTKEGDLADFSSRGTPREERLSNEDPLDDFDAPVITAPGTGRAFESNASRFTSAIVSTRAITNLTANGLTDDADLPLGMIPFYTQISGTSMATPFIAGTIALMLDADPTLSPDEIREILTSTATKMPGRADWEVGAGYVNAYAAVDKVFNRSRGYANFQSETFNTVFGEQRPPQQAFHINFNPALSGAASTNAKTFTVQPGMNVLDVFATVDTIAEEGTGNLVGIRLTSPSNVRYSTAIEFPVIGSSARQIVVQNPEAGTWTLEVRGANGLTAAQAVSSPTQIALPGPVDGTVTQIKYILPTISDIIGHSQQVGIEAAIKSRLIDTFTDGTFRPDTLVTRADLARTLVSNTALRQSLKAAARFTDVSGDLARIAEAVTANGSTNRDFNFIPKGLMSADGATFNPTGTVNRLDLAVAFIRAIGLDEAARARANQPVVFNGAALSDNAQIPGELRGYVQLAIDKGLFEAFPAEVRNLGNGQFQVLPGPRFEPNTTVTRATLATKLNSFKVKFTTGG
ncbi:MAG: S8 family serine peptidase [Pyrinomonadaceae bacterium]|nr:S8 family serine peptidase [Pyrinomonadaceae bacterium]